MQTYAGVTREPIETDVQKYCRERMEAAMSILDKIIGKDIEDEMLREMERLENKAEKRKQNLMMAGRALEAIRSANGHMLEQDFSQLSKPQLGAIYKTPYGMVMVGVKEVLEKFWTAE